MNTDKADDKQVVRLGRGQLPGQTCKDLHPEKRCVTADTRRFYLLADVTGAAVKLGLQVCDLHLFSTLCLRAQDWNCGSRTGGAVGQGPSSNTEGPHHFVFWLLSL